MLQFFTVCLLWDRHYSLKKNKVRKESKYLSFFIAGSSRLFKIECTSILASMWVKGPRNVTNWFVIRSFHWLSLEFPIYLLSVGDLKICLLILDLIGLVAGDAIRPLKTNPTIKGPSIKYVRKNLPIFDPPLPPVRSAYALVWTPPSSPPPLYARTQFSWIYRKYNTELVNRFFNANMLIFNYNMIFIKYKYICWILKKMRTYAAALTPPPPPVYAMRTHRPRPPSPPSVRTYFMDDP